jgi:hypothetical protein
MDRICSGPECQKRAVARGYCQAHYLQLRLGRDLQPLRAYTKRPPAVCSVEHCGVPTRSSSGLCVTHRKAAEIKPTCKGPDCDQQAVIRGYCPAHYQQWRLRKELTPVTPNMKRVSDFCSVPGCGRPYRARGVCAAHWVHLKKFGEVRPITVYDLKPPCGIAGCEEPSLAKRRCPKHLQYGYNLSRFHLSLEDFVRTMDEQGGVCAICGGINANGKALSVDHDHECCPGDRSCGACRRGLLCHGCNFAIGLMHDEPARLRAAATYVEAWRARPAPVVIDMPRYVGSAKDLRRALAELGRRGQLDVIRR